MGGGTSPDPSGGPADVTRFDVGDPTRTSVDPVVDPVADPTVTRRESGPGGTRPSATGSTKPSDDEVRVRFGAGPSIPAMWSPDSVPARHRRSNPRVMPFLSVALSMAVIGGLLAWLAFRGEKESTPLAVSGVQISTQGGQQRCDPDKLARTVDVFARVELNGSAGVLSYRWVQSDGTPGAFQKATVIAGQTAFEAPLHWTVSGEGSKELTATFELEQPTRTKASATFEYVCRP
ncbi:hypothetical protein [Actinocorallia sp. A-T 12471]|uniref:hypothetical protein n=1 Tax=Actinocorallia sp. A-T 12471 TaxID=3089813 RepID=UPI0029D0904E|nr:hypothetical protein [Actinocorallia sp. A-T 12471]MDX6742030.1 hypothetical protein [Actinocorallia sp. A-T 12471]